jgi:hypothetical protein
VAAGYRGLVVELGQKGCCGSCATLREEVLAQGGWGLPLVQKAWGWCVCVGAQEGVLLRRTGLCG